MDLPGCHLVSGPPTQVLMRLRQTAIVGNAYQRERFNYKAIYVPLPVLYRFGLNATVPWPVVLNQTAGG